LYELRVSIWNVKMGVMNWNAWSWDWISFVSWNAYSILYWKLCISLHVRQVMQEQVNSLILHTVHILKTTLAHTTGFTEWFITHPFYLKSWIRDKASWRRRVRCGGDDSFMRMGCIPIWLCALFFNIRICILIFKEGILFLMMCIWAFVTLIPLPSWLFGFIFDWVVYGCS
jgi:hypothetical protein